MRLNALLERLRPLLLSLVVVVPAVILAPAGDAHAAGTVLRDHPHEGTAGTVPTAAAEAYSGRSGQAVHYATSPSAAVGSTSLNFSGTAATFLQDVGLTTSTGQLAWSAPVLLPTLPPSGTSDRILAARTSTANLAMIEITSAGRVSIRNGGGTVKATGTTGLVTGRWYRVEVLLASGRTTVRVFDNSTAALLQTVGPAATTAGIPTIVRVGSLTVAGPVMIDHAQVADGWITELPPPPAPASNPCGALAGQYDPVSPPRYDHVVVLMEENWSYRNFITSTKAPFLSQMNADCGSETNFHAATHPSQPNYMAATSGIISAVGQRTSADNIFHQVQAAGLSWKSYEESMPSPCSGTQTSVYKAGHNPAYYYDDLRTPTNTCALGDVPMSPSLDGDIASDSLPTYSWITPNECHIFYWVTGCSTPKSDLTAEGDKWLAALLPRLTAMPSYQAGHTLILITFDEGREATNENYIDCTDPAYYSTHPDCQIPTVVVSPYLAPGTIDASDQNLYSLLGTTEDILGVPRLARAVGQPSMRATMPF